MARKIMESTILAVLGGLGGMGGFAGLVMLYNAWRESRRKDKEQESQLIQIAAKFNLEATSSATTLFSNIADRLDTENKDLRGRIVSLEVAKAESDKARQERDKQIDELKHGQEKMGTEMETLRKDNADKDKRIAEQEEEIKGLNQKLDRLTDYLRVKGVPFPDGWESGERK